MTVERLRILYPEFQITVTDDRFAPYQARGPLGLATARTAVELAPKLERARRALTRRMLA